MMQRSRRGGLGLALVTALIAFACAAAPASAAKPKLSLGGLQLHTTSAELGSSASVEGKLRNRRARAARPLLRFTIAAGEGIRIAERRVRVGARKRAGFTLAGTIPPATGPGEYAASVCIVRKRRDRCTQVARKLTVTRTGTPGARSLGDPLFPETGNGGFQVTHYDANLRWSDIGNVFLAGTTTTLTAVASQNLSEFSLDLEGLNVDGVTVDGAAAAFSRVAPASCSDPVPLGPCPVTKLVITPAATIGAGERFTASVSYSGPPQRHIDPDSAEEGWADTADGAFVVNEPVGAMTWIPCNNHPLDKATYDLTMTVPTGKTAIGNGELVEPAQDNGDGTTTWRWSSDDPLSTYLSTATVGDFDFEETQTVNGLPIYDFIASDFTAPEKALAEAQLDRQADAIDYFTTLYGAYPFDSGGAVVDDSDVGYALEVQTKSHFPSANVNPATFGHEIAHQWFGNSVTPTTWKDLWLNEGWAEWSEWIWDNEKNSNPVTPEQQFDTNYASPANDWSAAPADPTAVGLFTHFPVYVRPAMMLQALREIIGNGRFLTLARDWHASHRHGHGTTAQFIALAKDTSGFGGANLAKLDTFFQQWLFGTTKPTITPDNFF